MSQNDYSPVPSFCIRYHSITTSFLHACPRMAPCGISHGGCLLLSWKYLPPCDKTWHLHAMRRGFSTRRGISTRRSFSTRRGFSTRHGFSKQCGRDHGRNPRDKLRMISNSQQLQSDKQIYSITQLQVYNNYIRRQSEVPLHLTWKKPTLRIRSEGH